MKQKHMQPSEVIQQQQQLWGSENMSNKHRKYDLKFCH